MNIYIYIYILLSGFLVCNAHTILEVSIETFILRKFRQINKVKQQQQHHQQIIISVYLFIYLFIYFYIFISL